MRRQLRRFAFFLKLNDFSPLDPDLADIIAEPDE
jgi:hypothetical protein